jgi:hypothetical protein
MYAEPARRSTRRPEVVSHWFWLAIASSSAEIFVYEEPNVGTPPDWYETS